MADIMRLAAPGMSSCSYQGILLELGIVTSSATCRDRIRALALIWRRQARHRGLQPK